MPENFSNHYQSTLVSGISAGATSLVVASATGLPAANFRAIISAEGTNTEEIVLVTNVAGTTLTITRAVEAWAGVQAASVHAAGATFTAIITAVSMTGAGLSLLTGATNTGAGLRAAGSTTSGIDNTGVGVDAVKLTTTGSENTGLGANALFTNVAGNNNTAVGAYSQPQSTGSDNTSVGYNTQFNTNTGYSNTAVGATAMQGNTDGHGNTAVGLGSLKGNLSGQDNVGVGFNALVNAASTVDNTAVGASSLANISSGGFNTALGAAAGMGLTTTTQSILIGYNASATDGLTDQIVIGVNATSATSHQVVLGHTTITSTLLRGDVVLVATRTLMTGKGATGSRPSASAVGEGAQWYDQTLHKPIWSDGTNWRDAMANVV